MNKLRTGFHSTAHGDVVVLKPDKTGKLVEVAVVHVVDRHHQPRPPTQFEPVLVAAPITHERKLTSH